VEICDNGPGLAANSREGVGVANTRARLRQLYGADHRFEMRNRPDGGLVVTVAIPFREDLNGSSRAHDSDPG
jgi:LytS/YehU family sensor histidine kinase